MNPRIGKLAVKAGAHWDHGDWNMPSAVYFSEKDLEVFAELIVQECMNVLHENELWNRHISHVLKEHFGVNE